MHKKIENTLLPVLDKGTCQGSDALLFRLPWHTGVKKQIELHSGHMIEIQKDGNDEDQGANRPREGYPCRCYTVATESLLDEKNETPEAR